MSSPDVEAVLTWHAALNRSDIDGLLALSTPDVEVGGPRGAGSGSELLRDWVTRAGIRMQPGRVVRGNGSVVVEESAQWKTADGSWSTPRTVATVFKVRSERVSSVIRYDDLASALRASGLEQTFAL
jgi:hypothetical protein